VLNVGKKQNFSFLRISLLIIKKAPWNLEANNIMTTLHLANCVREMVCLGSSSKLSLINNDVNNSQDFRFHTDYL
jgi:hypothetical protein